MNCSPDIGAMAMGTNGGVGSMRFRSRYVQWEHLSCPHCRAIATAVLPGGCGSHPKNWRSEISTNCICLICLTGANQAHWYSTAASRRVSTPTQNAVHVYLIFLPRCSILIW